MPRRNTKIIEGKKIKRNWRNPKDYESMKDYSLERWAWEFLRRNPKYIEDWKEKIRDLKKKWVKSLPCKEWGMKVYRDPDIEYSKIEFIPSGGIHKAIYQKDPQTRLFIDKARPNLETGEIRLKFDVNLPLNPQIKSAKKALEEFRDEVQKKKGKIRGSFKPRHDDWIELIRVLDAMAVGAENEEIARCMFSREYSYDDPKRLKKLYDKKRQAKRYLERYYRLIPCSDK